MIKIFDEIFDSFENEDIKEFAKTCITSAPEYWSHVPASSTGKYHPSFSLGDGGLLRHTVAVARFLNYLFNIESIADQYTSRQRDLLRVAAITHDIQKSGTQADYEKSKYTRFDHPLRAATMIRELDGLPQNELEFIAHCVESHMGQWNTDKRSQIVLPKPKDKYQIILHVADYLASRKDIDMKFETAPIDNKEDLLDINTWRFTFGKYNGKTIPEVAKENPQYIEWAKANMEKEPAKTLLKNFELKEE